MDVSTVWDFCGEIMGTVRPRRGYVPATVTRIDADGTVWVTTGDGMEAPASSCSASVDVGDVVSVSWSGAQMGVVGNHTNPAPTTRRVRDIIRPVTRIAEQAKGIAAQAKAIADATGQFFWHDENGAHVSTEEGNPTGAQNILVNSLGVLIRKGSMWRAAFSESATAFYDGLGNAAGNITASFGADGATIGYADGAHIAISESGIDGTNVDGMEVMRVASEAATGSIFMDHGSHDGTVTWTEDQTEPIGFLDPINEDLYPPKVGGDVICTFDYEATETGGATATGSLSVTFSYGVHESKRIKYGSADTGITVGHDGFDDTEFIVVNSEPYQTAGLAEYVLTLRHVYYQTVETVPLPAFTFGTRTGDVQAFAFAAGEGIETAGEHQAVFGVYNRPDKDALFQVGNGTADEPSNALSVDKDGNVSASGRVFGRNGKLLWSGSYLMSADHTATLSGRIWEQPNGIVLVWSGYSGGQAQNYQWHFDYIPKEWVAAHDGAGITCVMAGAAFSPVAAKYVYLHDGLLGSARVTGYADNTQSGTANGITYNNAAFVLREVWGV